MPYLLMLFLCGIPLFYLEMNLGQFAGSGCITIFKIAPILKGIKYKYGGIAHQLAILTDCLWVLYVNN